MLQFRSNIPSFPAVHSGSSYVARLAYNESTKYEVLVHQLFIAHSLVFLVVTDRACRHRFSLRQVYVYALRVQCPVRMLIAT